MRYAQPVGLSGMGCIRIERVTNGYTVCVRDPAIEKANEKNDRWMDPERVYSFETVKGVTAFIEAVADKALVIDPGPPDPFAAAFKTASDEADKEE